MVRTVLLAVCVSAVTGSLSLSQVHAREILLNQVDPQGATLALAIVPHANDLPEWIQGDNLNNVSVEFEPRQAISGDDLQRNVGSSIKSQFAIKPNGSSGRQGKMKLETASRLLVDISRTDETLVALPLCGPSQKGTCRITDLSKEIVLAATGHVRGRSAPLTSLIAARGLVSDSRATKRVVVTVDDKNALQHADFIGLVRSMNEKLDAPDASSAFVVRLDRGGNFSIIERRQDATIDPSAIKFVGEE